MPEHIFISYSRQGDKDFAENLHDRLESAGFLVWLDIRDIPPGEDWMQCIDTAIRDCWCFIFVMTPTSVASLNCSDEWNRALRFKRPILPLMLATAIPPMRLDRLQYIDFTGDFDTSLNQLSQHLMWMRSLGGELQALRFRLDDLRHLSEYPQQAERFQVEIEDLQAQIAYKEQTMKEPGKVLDEYHNTTLTGIDFDKDRFAKERMQDRSMARNRVIGSAPQGASKSFKDRTQESARIINILLTEDSDIRAVSIYGKGGVGKTALACKIMASLEKDTANVHGLIYLSSRSRLGISLERIYLSSARMLGGKAEQELDKAWINPNTDVIHKIQLLLEHYDNNRYIILLDNLEDLLDTDGTPIDAELRLFIDACLRQQQSAKLLITSREPLNLAHDVRRHEYRCPLEQGLPVEDAMNLLKEFDYDRQLGLAEADSALLHSIIEKTHGYPRALEAVVGLLLQDPFLSLGTLLNNKSLFENEIIKNLVREAQSRLDSDSRRVMQALAVYNRPITEAAVRFLLEPFAQGLNVEGILRRLARGLYITVKRNTGEITLHPLDKEYNYRQIPDHGVGDYNQHFLESRAAAYYAHLCPPSETWRNISDLEPQLLEFEHLIKAEDYAAAARLLNEIDFNYLTLWGYAQRVISMRQQLLGKISDRKLEGASFSYLGYAYYTLGMYEQAIYYQEQGMVFAQSVQDRYGEGFAQGNLGRIYHNLGRYEDAIEHYMQAVEITREIGDKGGECSHLANMGIAFAYLDQHERTIEFGQKAVEIAREIQDRRGEGRALSSLGTAFSKLGQFGQAISYYQRALAYAREIDDKRGQSFRFGLLGDAYRDMGQYEQGLLYFEQGLSVARDMGARGVEGDLLTGLAKTYLSLGRYDEALDQLIPALKIALESQNLRAQQERKTLLAQTYLYMNRLSEALDAVSNLQQDISSDTLQATVLHGLILMRLDQRVQTLNIFQEVLVYMNDLLAKKPHEWSVGYMRGFVLCGLALLSDQERNTFLVQALEAYHFARTTCPAPGIVMAGKRLLDELLLLDRDNALGAVRNILNSSEIVAMTNQETKG